jgi:lipoprotein-releasing system ATP-binding protein
MITCQNIIKKFQDLVVLDNLSLNIEQGKTIAITGPSGSGKSTLLNLLAGLDSVNSGQIIINNIDITKLNEKNLSQFRKQNLGFIFQFHHLLSDFNLLENIAMPLLINAEDKKLAYNKAYDLLTQVGLGSKAKNFITQLSGGERQRGAILRAIIHNPKVILADEPTGNLDDENAHLIFDLLINLCKQYNTSLIIATHNLDLVAKLDENYHLNHKQLCKQH